MTPAAGLDWIREMLWTAMIVGAPVIVTVTVIGLLLAIVQAATQVNDSAVPFAAKALGVVAAIAIFGSWMLAQMHEFTIAAFEAMARITTG
ncbi:MAG: flagellar biosynthetic protein FliQ [Sandaracinaceae bacterium]|nr:flagellar biosynthetic protein FliQ [Sandaracinaceae bacterium]